MRRILLVVGMLALAVAIPSVASAHGRHHHRHHHHHASRPDAGTVESFTAGTLTIRVADGDTVSGAVDDDTVVNCIPAHPSATTAHHDEGDDDQGDDDGDRHHGHDACDASDLVAGTVVHVAILKLGSDGPEFKLVLLHEQEA